METIDKPESHTRELTKTEVDIAVAQIADRMSRVVRFAASLDECGEEFDDLNPSCPVVQKHRTLFSIPDGVHPMVWERPTLGVVDAIKKLIRKWVRGTLSADECATVYLRSVDLDEYDISWVFMDEPSFFYTESVIDLHASCLKFCEIGSRNAKGKAQKLTVPIESLRNRAETQGMNSKP